MTRRIALPFLSRRPAQADAPAEPAAAPAARRPRVGLWVLTAFVVVAAMAEGGAVLIGSWNPEMLVLVPLALFWIVVVCAAFAVRAALIGVGRSVAPPQADKPDVEAERLARMVRAERKREARVSPAQGLLLHHA